MEAILVKTAQLLLSLSILVVLHEFGHFMFARLFKTRVEKFYLFFDPWFSLFKVKKGETEYGVGWLPLGGYVKISGMIDESMDKEAMKLPPKPYEFRSKPAWQRLLIMVGGVLMNFIFAILIYVGVLYAWGESYLPTANAKYGIVVSEVGKEIGFQDGDKILSVDGKHVESFSKVIPTIVLDAAKTVQVERNGQSVDVEISDADLALLLKSKEVFAPGIPFKLGVESFSKNSVGEKAGLKVGDEVKGIDGNYYTYYNRWIQDIKSKAGEDIVLNIERNGEPMDIAMKLGDDAAIGFVNSHYKADVFEWQTINYGFFESFPEGIRRGVETTGDYLKQFKLFFKPETKAYESLGGFATIGNIFPSTWDWESFWNMTAFISIILAIMNLLPIPALDGGHVMFLVFEMVSGKKPGEKFLEYAQIVGMVILLALVLYANANDIIKMINGTF
ncbi:RIP metalloprotease RseP [Maribellus maritimus]|uniref:RIP metalloprotease RseP n=1 Tax=Maribellus maritimus TaxID=2870838 RepID=UPI001EECF1A9|nr:RIP metalloprotease RseP [Maribellus maritimus]MCG6191061.1 RIP metalloprotease RseP [Maribellus maritimus]